MDSRITRERILRHHQNHELGEEHAQEHGQRIDGGVADGSRITAGGLFSRKCKGCSSQINENVLNYPKMLQAWNATEFVFLSDDCVGFKVSTPIYKGNVLITWQDNTIFTVQFRDMELKIMGIPNAEEVLDAVKDYVENGEVWV